MSLGVTIHQTFCVSDTFANLCYYFNSFVNIFIQSLLQYMNLYNNTVLFSSLIL